MLCVHMVCKAIVKVADKTVQAAEVAGNKAVQAADKAGQAAVQAAEVAGDKGVQAAAVFGTPLAKAVDVLEKWTCVAACAVASSRARSLRRCPDAACGLRPTRRADATRV